MNEVLDDIIDYKHNDDENYYAVLGCDELSTTEQITAEYKARVLHCHPDKHPNNPSKAAEFERIQTARDVLCDDEKRANYDKWRHSGISLPFNKWCNMRGAVHTSMHWMTPKKESMIEGIHASPNSNIVESCSSVTESPSRSCQHVPDYRGFKSKNEVHVPWQREQPSEMLRKFRNYEI